jgi:hypothetical protein
MNNAPTKYLKKWTIILIIFLYELMQKLHN